MRSNLHQRNICILGIGNLLWADEGFGVRCIESIQNIYEFPPHVSLLDGGTQGLYLLEFVQAADVLIIFDAIDYGLAPGVIKTIEDDDVPQFLGAKKMSLHQTGFQEVLSLAQLTGKYPSRVKLIGCQPEVLDDYGGSLYPLVRSAIEKAIDLAIEELRFWGVDPKKRKIVDLYGVDGRFQPELNILMYEENRPSALEACRYGDERFLTNLD